jgi:hypothetical protein
MKFIAKYQKLYHSSDRNTKSCVISLISKTSGYQPKYTIRLLNDFEISENNKEYTITGRCRKPLYQPVKWLIIKLWEELVCIWSERLKEFICDNINWISLKYELKSSSDKSS